MSKQKQPKQQAMSVRVSEQLLRNNRPLIYEIKGKAKCFARGLLNKLQDKKHVMFSSLLTGEYTEIAINGKKAYILNKKNHYEDYKVFATKEEVESYLAVADLSSNDLDRLIEKEYKAIERRLEILADKVLIADAADRKDAYEKFILELEKAQIMLETKAESIYKNFISGNVTLKNNC